MAPLEQVMLLLLLPLHCKLTNDLQWVEAKPRLRHRSASASLLLLAVVVTAAADLQAK